MLYVIYLIKTKKLSINAGILCGYTDLKKSDISIGSCERYFETVGSRYIDIADISIKDLGQLSKDLLKNEDITDETKIRALIEFQKD